MLLMRESDAEPARDKRVKHPDWTENAMFSFIRESYLVAAKSLLSSVRDVKGLDPANARKVDFYTRQFVDAISPSNFIATNPEVLTTTLQTGGQNLLRGLENLRADLDRGEGRLSITMTDMKSFRLGENIATTPGKVVYQNDLTQLLQYEPSRPDVRRRPLLIVPPWINKFYVLDLQPKNSFIKWCVDQGHTVFVISWVNPDERLAQKSFEDYMLEGPLAAIDAIDAAIGERSVNAVGYCLGGTLLASTLGYLAAHGDDRIASATYFVTLVDFTDVGDIAVFIDEDQIASLEKRMQERGYLEAHDMATSFNMLRANDLIWSFVVNNYISARKGADTLRPPVLEFGLDPHACCHALLLSAQHVPAEPAGEAGRNFSRRDADRSVEDQGADIPPRNARRSHCAMEIELCGDATLFRARQIRSLGLRSHGRRDQRARQQVRPLDQ